MNRAKRRLFELMDTIIDLQNYNEKLEKENKHLNEQLDVALKDYDKQEERIEDAINYIEKNSGMISKFTGQKTTYVQEELTTDQLDELLEILKED